MKFTLVALILCLPVFANAYQVIGISEGDTMTLKVDGQSLKIRLSNIDAPEKKQPFGQKSKKSLSDLCWGKDAQYKAQTIDRYQRTVAVVTFDGLYVNREQVRRGMAWVYTKYNQDPSNPAIEEVARERKIGIWSDASPVPPWDWRKEMTWR